MHGRRHLPGSQLCPPSPTLHPIRHLASDLNSASHCCQSCTQALLDGGYTLLDVRTELESNSKGKIRGSVCIPCAFARQQFDAAAGRMVSLRCRLGGVPCPPASSLTPAPA